MLNTKIASETKLQISNEKLMVNTDFWGFYMKHINLINMILNSHLTKYGTKYNLDDLRNEVIVSLFNNNVFAKYDASKSKLNTFLTNTITYYIRHCIRMHSIRGKDIDKYLPTPSLGLDKPMRAQQVYMTSLNGYDSEDTQEELASEEDILDSIDKKLRFEKLNADLNGDIRDCVSWLVQGFTLRDIAEKKNTNHGKVTGNYFAKIKRAMIRTGFVTE